jgi:hypothetical protein
MGLSEPVATALDAAVATVEDLVAELTGAEEAEARRSIEPKSRQQ